MQPRLPLAEQVRNELVGRIKRRGGLRKAEADRWEAAPVGGSLDRGLAGPGARGYVPGRPGLLAIQIGDFCDVRMIKPQKRLAASLCEKFQLHTFATI